MEITLKFKRNTDLSKYLKTMMITKKDIIAMINDLDCEELFVKELAHSRNTINTPNCVAVMKDGEVYITAFGE